MKWNSLLTYGIPALFILVGIILINQPRSTYDVTKIPKETVVQWISIPTHQDTDIGYLLEGKNWNQIYWRENFVDTLVSEADASKFKIVSSTPSFASRYGKDATHVFFASGASVGMVVGADTNTFMPVYASGYDARDKNHEYLGGKVVQ